VIKVNKTILRGEPLGPRVTDVKATDDYRLFVTFTNGEVRLFDANPLLQLPAFKPLNNLEFFKSVGTGFGTIVWPKDIDYCPDTLYEESVPII
jgi:hypothetical protein